VKKKAMVWILLNIGVVIFILMSIIFYYLIPVAGSIMDYLRKAVEEILRLFLFKK